MKVLKCFNPPSEEKLVSRKLDKDINTWIKPYNYAIKILLLGAGEAGKTTILKQMRIISLQDFTLQEREDRAKQIMSNVHEAITELILQLRPLGLEAGPSVSAAADLLLGMGPTFTNEYFDIVEKIWSDPAIKNCLKRSNEFQLIDSAEYFLTHLEKVRKPGYIPDDADILQCRQRTTGIQKVQFKMKLPKSMQGGEQEFWMYDVGGQRGERKKWIQVFEGIHAVWFLVASSDFDQTLREDNSQNRLTEAVNLFEDVWKSRFLLESGLIVFLNKQDILERKVREGRCIGDHFPEYHNFRVGSEQATSELDEYTKTKLFIKSLLIEVTQRRAADTVSSLPRIRTETSRPRECYYHFTIATDTHNIRTIFKDVHHLLLTNSLANMGML